MSMVGIILAGGKSTRMKQDKALLELENLSLLQRQFKMLEKNLGQGNVIISGNRAEFTHIKDIDPHCGPVEGVKSVCKYFLDKNQLKSLLIIPVDMPFLTDDGIKRLVHVSSSKQIIKFSGHQLPFVVNDLAAAYESIKEMQEGSGTDNKVSFRSFFKRMDVQEIDAEPEKFFTNVNTPQDWNEALS